MTTVDIRVLPPDPKRGNARPVRIHYFVRDATGPAATPGGSILTAAGPISTESVRGYIACKPELKDVTPQERAGVFVVTPHSDDPRAVTCPECKQSAPYAETMALFAEMLAVNEPVKE